MQRQVATRYLCNLVLPGAAKSGTSALHDLLDLHPSISMSRPKEPQHFSFDDRYARGAEHHNSLFARTGESRYFGESSQCYMVHEHALERITGDLEKPKAVIVLRHPVERLKSHYRWNYKLGVEKQSLLDAIKERGEDTDYAPDPKVGMYRERGGYLAFSRYSRWVPLWQSALGEENVLVVLNEEMKANQQKVASRCFEFLGLEDIEVGAPIERNTTESTFWIAAPAPLRRAAKLVPPVIKNSKAYQGLVLAIRRSMTSEPPADLGDAERELIEQSLAEDLRFYESFRSRA